MDGDCLINCLDALSSSGLLSSFLGLEVWSLDCFQDCIGLMLKWLCGLHVRGLELSIFEMIVFRIIVFYTLSAMAEVQYSS